MKNLDNEFEVELKAFGPIKLHHSIKLDIESALISEKGLFEIQYPYLTLKIPLEKNPKVDIKKSKIEDLIITPTNIILKTSIKQLNIPLYKVEL